MGQHCIICNFPCDDDKFYGRLMNEATVNQIMRELKIT